MELFRATESKNRFEKETPIFLHAPMLRHIQTGRLRAA
jgi:hypothetical protein